MAGVCRAGRWALDSVSSGTRQKHNMVIVSPILERDDAMAEPFTTLPS